MIPIHSNIVDSAIKHFKPEIDTFSTTIESRLRVYSRSISGKRKIYVAYLITIAPKLISMPVGALQVHKRALDKIITPKQMTSKQFIPFKDKILKVLGYSERRKDFYPKYFQYLGIKACTYCNSQLTVTSEKLTVKKGKKNTEYKARFQVDHYLAKSEYPAFSISLFNLYPSCATCNLSKSFHKVDFELYSTNPVSKGSKYAFSLKPGSLPKYITSQDMNDLELRFSGPAPRKGFKDLKAAFDIEGIYTTQKDLIAELIMKSQIYTKGYKQTLALKFSSLFKKDPGLLDRLIVGNYTQEKDIHKRPMTKFMIDMSKEVGLLK